MIGRIVFFLVCFSFSSSLHSEEIKIYFKNLYRNDIYKGSSAPLYLLDFDTLEVKIHGKPDSTKLIPVRLPDMRYSKDTAFFNMYFTGNPNSAFSKLAAFLVGNYKHDTTFIWADLNGNLDFNDDNAFFTISPQNPSVFISLPNVSNPKGKFVYMFEKKVYEDSTLKARAKEYFYNDNRTKGFITTESDFWFNAIRNNIISCDTIIDGEKVQIGLMDWDCNGLYNDIDTVSKNNFSSDRILVGRYGDEIISSSPSGGAVQILPETLIPIKGNVYSLKEIEPSGEYIIIEKTDKKYNVLREGDLMPDLAFALLDGTETSLKKEIPEGRFALLDFWAIGCKGCLLAAPKISKLDSLYSGRLKIIGLHDSRANSKIIRNCTDKYSMNWTQGILTAEIEKALLSSGGYPYYVLIGPNGRIMKFNTNLNEVEMILSGSE